jgi:hypothetical protein
VAHIANKAVILFGSAGIRKYAKEHSGTFFLRQCLPYFFSSRSDFVGALAREYTDTPMHLPAFLHRVHFLRRNSTHDGANPKKRTPPWQSRTPGLAAWLW